MATQIKISELPLANESALSLAADDRLIFNNDNVNTQTIKFANFVDAICEQNLTFKGNCQFTQPITGPNGGDIQVGLDDLVDVTFTNVTSGQVLQYSGVDWINKDVSDIALQLDSLSVTTAAASAGGALTYDDTTGEFTFAPADLSSAAALTSFSAVNSQVATGGGSLAYASATGVFTFSPADAYTKAESYSKTQVDSALGDKSDTATTYTKTEVDTLLGGKASNDLVGVVSGATNLGTFTGSTIPANQNVKQALQALEVQVEANETSIAAVPTDVYTKTEANALLADKISIDGGLTVTASPASGGGSLAYDDAGALLYQPADLTPYALTANPTFTGAPSAPTAVAGTNTTQLATTAFVTAGIAANNAAYISIADLKTLVAGTADYSEFQTAIAAL